MYLAIKLVLCVFALCDLIVFMVHWAIAYLEPCETSKMELFAKLVTSKVVTFLFRRLKGFWKCLCRVQYKLLCQFLVYIAAYFRSEITCTFCRSFEWLASGKTLIKTKLNGFINSVCFRVQSITKKDKHGNYSVKIHSEMYGTWDIKVHN